MPRRTGRSRPKLRCLTSRPRSLCSSVWGRTGGRGGRGGRGGGIGGTISMVYGGRFDLRNPTSRAQLLDSLGVLSAPSHVKQVERALAKWNPARELDLGIDALLHGFERLLQGRPAVRSAPPTWAHQPDCVTVYDSHS